MNNQNNNQPKPKKIITLSPVQAVRLAAALLSERISASMKMPIGLPANGKLLG